MWRKNRNKGKKLPARSTVAGINVAIESRKAASLGFGFAGFIPQTEDLLHKGNMNQY